VAVDFVPSSGVQEHYVLSAREGRESRSLPSQTLDPKVLFLLDYRDAESFRISNQFRPADLTAGHHLEIGSNAGPDCPARIPTLPKLLGKVHVLLKPVIDSVHASLNIRQCCFLVT
jgi:hypothetical protein